MCKSIDALIAHHKMWLFNALLYSWCYQKCKWNIRRVSFCVNVKTNDMNGMGPTNRYSISRYRFRFMECHKNIIDWALSERSWEKKWTRPIQLHCCYCYCYFFTRLSTPFRSQAQLELWFSSFLQLVFSISWSCKSYSWTKAKNRQSTNSENIFVAIILLNVHG